MAADWGPTGLAAGKEFFPTDEQSGNQSLLAMPVPDASLIPERPSATPADLAWAGLEVTAGSVRLPAVLPAALLGQRYGRAALPRLALDMCAFSALGAVLAWNLLPDEIPWFQAPGMAPFGALLLVTARRVSARLPKMLQHQQGIVLAMDARDESLVPDDLRTRTRARLEMSLDRGTRIHTPRPSSMPFARLKASPLVGQSAPAAQKNVWKPARARMDADIHW